MRRSRRALEELKDGDLLVVPVVCGVLGTEGVGAGGGGVAAAVLSAQSYIER
jgi:hypothetical protein